MVTIAIQLLFHSQTVTGFQRQGAAGFGSSGSRSTYYVTAGIDIEATVVDSIGNITCSSQFIGISTGRSNHLASGIAASTIAYIQCSGICCYRVSRAAGSCIHVRGNLNTVARSYLAGSGSLRCFQLVLSCTASAGDVVRIPSFVGQSGYGTGIAVDLNRVATGGWAYGDAVSQFEAHLVVGYSGDDVAVAFVGNGLSQLDSIGSRAVTDLEAVFFQVVQLAAVDGFFAACSNVAVCHVTQSHRAACSTAYQVHFVARCSSRIACCIGIGHRGIELHSGHTVGGADVRYSTLAVGEVDGVAVGHEVFVGAVTLYGKACVQYVVNGRSVVAFVVGSQCGTIVVGRIGGGCSSISQVALHVGQCGRRSSAAGRILHAGNHVAGGYFVATCRCIIEFAVGAFVYFRTISFGVYHRGLGVLHYGLGIQSVGVGLVTVVSVHFLFHSQTVTCSKGYFLAWFNGSGGGSSTTGQSTTGSGLEAAVVDGVGNVARCGQFACISSSRRSYFAVGYRQRSGGYGLRSNLTRHSFQLSNVYYISIFLTCSYPRNLTSNIICNIAYRYCCFSRSPSSIIFSCNCIQRISSFHTCSGRSNRLITHSNSTIYGCFGVRTQGYSISNGSRSCSSSIIRTGANGNIVIAIQVACSSPTNHGIMLTLRFQTSLFTNTNTGITYIAIHGLGAYCNIVITIAIDCCRIANCNSTNIIACTLTRIKTNRYTIHSTSFSTMPGSKRTGSSCRTTITYRNRIITGC